MRRAVFSLAVFLGLVFSLAGPALLSTARADTGSPVIDVVLDADDDYNALSGTGCPAGPPPPPPPPYAVPTTGVPTPGSTFHIRGRNFTPNSQVRVYIAGPTGNNFTSPYTAPTDCNGIIHNPSNGNNFFFPFVSQPSSDPGYYWAIVNDSATSSGTWSNWALFTTVPAGVPVAKANPGEGTLNANTTNDYHKWRVLNLTAAPQNTGIYRANASGTNNFANPIIQPNGTTPPAAPAELVYKTTITTGEAGTVKGYYWFIYYDFGKRLFTPWTLIFVH